jgi:hypothetical protein
MLEEKDLRNMSPVFPNFIATYIQIATGCNTRVLSTIVRFKYHDKWYRRHIIKPYPPRIPKKDCMIIFEGIFKQFVQVCYETEHKGFPAHYDIEEPLENEQQTYLGRLDCSGFH